VAVREPLISEGRDCVKRNHREDSLKMLHYYTSSTILVLGSSLELVVREGWEHESPSLHRKEIENVFDRQHGCCRMGGGYPYEYSRSYAYKRICCFVIQLLCRTAESMPCQSNQVSSPRPTSWVPQRRARKAVRPTWSTRERHPCLLRHGTPRNGVLQSLDILL
jgi:hypothetical protein